MISDSSKVVAISRISSAGWVMIDEEPQANADGWDQWQVVVVRDYGATQRTARQILDEWRIGRRFAPGIDFWVTAAVPACRGGNVWQATLTLMGRFDPARPVKFNVSASTQTLSIATGGTATVGAPYFSGPRIVNGVTSANVLNAFPVIEASYILIGTMPPTQNVGRAGAGYQTPPLTLQLKPELVSYLNQPQINLPFGYVLTAMPFDMLAGTDVPASAVKETWTYTPFRT
jgi:hypothetical protein